MRSKCTLLLTSIDVVARNVSFRIDRPGKFEVRGRVARAGTKTATRPCGAAGGKMSRGVIVAGFESDDSSSWPAIWHDAADGVRVSACRTRRACLRRLETQLPRFSQTAASTLLCGLRSAESHVRLQGRRRGVRSGVVICSSGLCDFSAIDPIGFDGRRGAYRSFLRRSPGEGDAGVRLTWAFKSSIGSGSRIELQRRDIGIRRGFLLGDARADRVGSDFVWMLREIVRLKRVDVADAALLSVVADHRWRDGDQSDGDSRGRRRSCEPGVEAEKLRINLDIAGGCLSGLWSTVS